MIVWPKLKLNPRRFACAARRAKITWTIVFHLCGYAKYLWHLCTPTTTAKTTKVTSTLKFAELVVLNNVDLIKFHRTMYKQCQDRCFRAWHSIHSWTSMLPYFDGWFDFTSIMPVNVMRRSMSRESKYQSNSYKIPPECCILCDFWSRHPSVLNFDFFTSKIGSPSK